MKSEEDTGRKLAEIHLNYESIDPYDGIKISIEADEDDPETYSELLP